MRHLIVRRRRLVSGALAAAIAFVLFADCAVAAQATAAQKACCAAMAKGCGPQAKGHSCCTTDAPLIDQSAATPRFAVASPTSVIAIIVHDIPAASIAAVATDTARDHHGGSPPRAVPSYILHSLFRV